MQLDSRYFIGLEGRYNFELHFILQEEKAPVGKHIVRARGSTPATGRSVSAEVDLKPGRYKVLPKILALNTTRATVEDVVKKMAERKPQKLRQIGLNYDLAHAKGFSVDWEDMDETEPGENQSPAIEKKQKRWRERSTGGSNASAAASPPLPSPATMSDAGETDHQDGGDDDFYPFPPESKAKPKAKANPKAKTKPWNAVCVIGLRIYSKDSKISIKLVRPQNAEEGAALAADSIIPAGATM